MPPAASEADQSTIAQRDEDAMPTAGVSLQPLPAMLDPNRFDVERRV